VAPSRRTTYNEENSKNAEAAKLNSLATEGINSSDGNPVARDSTSKDDDDVADSGVVQELVDVVGILGGVADDLEDSAVVQAKTIKGHIKTEP
jgi:hypothetical protein